MRRKLIQKILYATGSWANIAAIIPAILGVFSEVDSSRSPYSSWPAVILRVTDYLNDWSLLLYTLVIVILIYGPLARRAGDPWVWENIQYLIDGMRDHIWEDFETARMDEHRVTLFQRKSFALFLRRPKSSMLWPYGRGCHPWSGWLVPVLRSGHTAQVSRSIFLAPSGGTSHTVEGVVGKAWSSKSTIIINDLKKIHQDSALTTKRTYATKTFCDVGFVDRYLAQNRTPPRSIGAIPIEVHGKIWGALVLDSQEPHGVSNEKTNQFKLTTKLIGKLLERA